MELILNFCWLLLIAPALCLWARQTTGSKRFQNLIALTCLLVLLFPVVSASDDLHAMRQEMEESSSSKHSSRQAKINDVSSQNHFSLPALTSTFFVCPCDEISGMISPQTMSAACSTQIVIASGRAPPPFPS
jgi:hypothetical protein